ncbi:MAG: hypothetical protein QOD83_3696 [Solirubrobacteraceae bacterium]|jgi:hypothetical protein|nr:hypothetical protein [Solirubrobacteraceae bacterium]
MHDTDRQAHSASSTLGNDVRAVADVLAALFDHDRQLAAQLNEAQTRLLGAAGPEEDCAAAPESGALAAAIEGVGDSIRRAFVDYQHVAEERRQLAADVGEATVRIVDALIAAGHSEAQARTADVRALRDGVYRQAG